jgi:hypothetical protein
MKCKKKHTTGSPNAGEGRLGSKTGRTHPEQGELILKGKTYPGIPDEN